MSSMNRQTKRQMAKQGTDKPRARRTRRQSPQPARERTGPRQYFARSVAS